MNKLIATIALLGMLIAPNAFAQSFPSSYRGVPYAGDPCLSFPHLSAPLAVASATTTKVISNTAGQDVYICGISASIIASATLSLINGTGTLCATAPATGVATSMGAMTGGASAIVQSSDTLGTKIFVPAGNDICAVGTGAGAPAAGVITYVKVISTNPR